MPKPILEEYTVKKVGDDWGVFVYEDLKEDGNFREKLIIQADNRKDLDKALDDYLDSLDEKVQEPSLENRPGKKKTLSDLKRDISSGGGSRSVIERVTPDMIDKFSAEEIELLLYNWNIFARPEQLPPKGKWKAWLLMAGRGFGKTKTGAEYINSQAMRSRKSNPLRMSLIARTAKDARDTMVLGESGVVTCSPPWNPAVYYPSKSRVEWLSTGAIALMYSAEKPDSLRGPESTILWGDELAAWKFATLTYTQAVLGNRLQYFANDGKYIYPHRIWTTTPRPGEIIRKVIEDPKTVVTKGSTLDNIRNLDKDWADNVLDIYSDTTVGRQEIYGELLSEIPGALWKLSDIEKGRVSKINVPIEELVVSVDPPVRDYETSECGIIVSARGSDNHFYVIEDYSVRGSPAKWGQMVIQAYKDHAADSIVVETNQGGDMAIKVIMDSAREFLDEIPRVHDVSASQRKTTRAERPSMLYEQGRAHHVGVLPRLEDQLTTYVGKGKSPDILDALVWGCIHLMFKNKKLTSERKIIQLRTKW